MRVMQDETTRETTTGERPGGAVRTVLVIAGVVLAVYLGVVFIADAVVPNVLPKRFSTVDEGVLYRAGKLTPAAMRTVVAHNDIKTIVDLGAWEEGSPADERAQASADAMGVTRYRFHLYGDTNGNPNHYLNALRIIQDPANQPVLVHCGAGTERTGYLVALYRTFVEGVPLDEAIDEADRKGHSPSRNPVFAKTVETWTTPIEQAYRNGGSVEGADPVPPPTPVGHEK